MKHISLLAALIILSVVLFSGCARPPAETKPEPELPASLDRELIVVPRSQIEDVAKNKDDLGEKYVIFLASETTPQAALDYYRVQLSKRGFFIREERETPDGYVLYAEGRKQEKAVLGIYAREKGSYIIFEYYP